MTDVAQHGPSAKYVLLYDDHIRTITQALERLFGTAVTEDTRNDILRVQEALTWTPPPTSSHHTIGVQVTALEEGEDDDGDYDAEDVELTSHQVMGAIIDQLGRTESGMGFEAELDLDGTKKRIKFEWNGAFPLEPRWDV